MHSWGSEYTLEVLTQLPLKWHLREARAPSQVTHLGSVLLCSFHLLQHGVGIACLSVA